MTVEQALFILRGDAQDRGLHDLALIYGWSLMRINADRVIDSIKLLGKPK